MNKYSIERNNFHNYRKHFLKIMRITLFFLFFCIFYSSAINNSYSQEFTFNRRASIKEICKEIESRSDYIFVFSDNSEELINKKVNVNTNSKSVNEVLDDIFTNSGLTYRILDKQVVVYKSNIQLPSQKTEQVISRESKTINQQTKQIRGRVIDANGDAVVGANIIEVGTYNGTITDINGQFQLEVANNATLHISFIGYLSQNIETNNLSTINVTLLEDTQALEEIVVVGYGSQAKKDITGSVAVIDTESLLKTTGSSPTQLLQGKSPGIYIGQTGSPGSPTNVRIRGFNTINSNGPLYVIDGVSTQTQDLSSINPNDIESMQVLKDASASAIYGAQAANGVIIITTKQGIRSGKTVLNYDGYYGFQRAQNNWDLMDSYELMDFLWESQLNSLRLRGDFISQPYNAQLGRGPKPIIPNYMVSGEGAEGRQDIDPDKYHMPDYIITGFGNTNWFYVINRTLQFKIIN